ncbi:2og-fe oxygenase family [Rhypophila decipiens]|uniref:2og-fe oxygenase family n=1 Tax=Rhypophila decipiens TaxID=261697 RepID=A0AAN6YJ33_9PEZI|nr:2og-fe oxygenase family [Rhypophila decipiens]
MASSTSEPKMANLSVVNLRKLKNRDEAEMQKLLQVSTAPGVFFLDLRLGSLLVLEEQSEIYSLAKTYFAQSPDDKMKDARLDQQPDQDRGYKQSECDETFEMSLDEFHVTGSTNINTKHLPPIFVQKSNLCHYYSHECHRALLPLLSCLSTSLSLPPDQALSTFHRESEKSDSGLKLIYEACKPLLSEVVDNLHTDSGTFTMLFYDGVGLEFELVDKTSNTTSWEFAPLLPEGCALVNVADSLARLSGGVLHSPRHRVTQIGDGFMERYYISYFLRPERALKEKWASEAQ